MFQTYRPGAAGPLGRAPTVPRVFEKCQCEADTRMGRCTDGKRHRRWEAQKQMMCDADGCTNQSAAKAGLQMGEDPRITDPAKCLNCQPDGGQGG